MELTVDRLVDACGDDGSAAGLVIQTELEPLAGAGAPVKPAVYEGGSYQVDRRWLGEGPDSRAVDVVIVDNVPSQANRLETGLLGVRDQAGLPELLLDLSGLGLPVHLPRSISSFRFPHRNADAYLRDAQLDGVDFLKTDVGRAIFDATPWQPEALYEWMPQALLFGFWQSHLGKKRQQTKHARSWVSEVVGYEPASLDTRVKGLKGDPLNLSIEESLEFAADDQREWSISDSNRKGGRDKDALSAVGHGQVPVDGAPAGVSFRSLMQRSTVSLAGLRQVGGPSPDAAAAGRALLVALGVLGHATAFGRAFTLRSGCDLRAVSTSWRWLGEDGDVDVDPVSTGRALELLVGCADRAAAAGLPVGPRWQTQPLVLTAKPALRTAIEKSWPVGDD